MNTETSSQEPTQNDRIMAALAHATAILPVTGVIAPIIIWVTQREKSEYVAFQALQAVVYQFSMIVAWFASMALYMGSFFIVIPFSASSRGFPAIMLVPFGVMGLMLVGSLIFIVYAFVAAGMVLQGRNFRYVIIGNALKHYLQAK
jgi:uncharacterized protein